MTWLNCLEEKVSGSVIFLSIVKEMWDTLKAMHENEKNPSRFLKLISACLSSSRKIDL